MRACHYDDDCTFVCHILDGLIPPMIMFVCLILDSLIPTKTIVVSPHLQGYSWPSLWRSQLWTPWSTTTSSISTTIKMSIPTLWVYLSLIWGNRSHFVEQPTQHPRGDQWSPRQPLCFQKHGRLPSPSSNRVPNHLALFHCQPTSFQQTANVPPPPPQPSTNDPILPNPRHGCSHCE